MSEEVTKVNGIWNDHPVSLKTVWGGHTFTDIEVQNLFEGKTIEFEAISKSGKPYTVKGKLAEQEYNDNTFIGFKPEFETKSDDAERYEGMWNDKQVKFKRNWGGHRFSDEECMKLCNGDVIEFKAVSKAGKDYIARGMLEEQEYNGNKFIGFKLNFNG